MIPDCCLAKLLLVHDDPIAMSFNFAFGAYLFSYSQPAEYRGEKIICSHGSNRPHINPQLRLPVLSYKNPDHD